MTLKHVGVLQHVATCYLVSCGIQIDTLKARYYAQNAMNFELPEGFFWYGKSYEIGNDNF
jgi:hypothetical protein